VHLVQRLYRGVILPTEIDRRVVTGIVPALRVLPGFISFSTVDFGGGLFGSFTLYARRDEAERVSAAAPGVVRNSLGDLIPGPAEVRGGTVLHRRRTEGKASVMIVRRYEGCADPAELKRRITAQLLPRFAALPGLHGYCLVDDGQGRVSSLSLFGTPEDADVLGVLAAPLVQRNLSDLLPLPPETLVGQVLSESLAPAST
jgi:hypothetical protein